LREETLPLESNSLTSFPEYEPKADGVPVFYPAGSLLRTKPRDAYEPETLRLVIPRMKVDSPIQDGTELYKLEKGPGLYSYAQPPDWANTNTSIAAHRDIHGMEFYSINTLGEGDYIYLVYKNKVFRYLHQYTVVVEADNWDPIRVFSDCRVTLTTCDPIGTSEKRMIAVGTLVDINDFTDDYVFK
jgi:sortase A